MEGSFACPECGAPVEIHGLAPGRQVRCNFCNRLLEVPYLPRTADSPWRRRRFNRPRWLPWVWAAVVVLFGAIIIAGGAIFFSQQWHSSEDRSISHLVESSRQQEANGAFGPALVDLDAAIDVARRAGPRYIARLEVSRKSTRGTRPTRCEKCNRPIAQRAFRRVLPRRLAQSRRPCQPRPRSRHALSRNRQAIPDRTRTSSRRRPRGRAEPLGPGRSSRLSSSASGSRLCSSISHPFGKRTSAPRRAIL